MVPVRPSSRWRLRGHLRRGLNGGGPDLVFEAATAGLKNRQRGFMCEPSSPWFLVWLHPSVQRRGIKATPPKSTGADQAAARSLGLAGKRPFARWGG